MKIRWLWATAAAVFLLAPDLGAQQRNPSTYVSENGDTTITTTVRGDTTFVRTCINPNFGFERCYTSPPVIDPMAVARRAEESTRARLLDSLTAAYAAQRVADSTAIANQLRQTASRPTTNVRAATGPVRVLAFGQGRDFWATPEECIAASDTPFYVPVPARQIRALGANEVVRGLPRNSCIEMDLPDRMVPAVMNGRGWVRVEAGRRFVYNTQTGQIVRMYECNNDVYNISPLPLPVGPQGPEGQRGPRGEQGPPGDPGRSFSAFEVEDDDGWYDWWMGPAALAALAGTACILDNQLEWGGPCDSSPTEIEVDNETVIDVVVGRSRMGGVSFGLGFSP